MSAHDLLDRLKVTSPCSADWNSMTGNDRVRFCEHCSLKVHNLSQMTPLEAARLVARSRGRLCVRYYSDSAGDIITRSSDRVHQIGRRVSRIAAGAFTATLSLSAAAVAHPSFEEPSNIGYSAQFQQPGTRREGGVLVGTITDPHGARIPLASVSLVSSQTRFGLATSTNDAGEFTFLQLPAGLYKLRIEAFGFEMVEIDNLYIDASGEIRFDRTLSVTGFVEEVEIRSELVVMAGGVGLPPPQNPLVRAAQEDKLDNVESLIAGADVNFRDKATGTTALEHAVSNGNREMVQLLLSKGADVNARNSIGRTVLMMLDDDATSDLVWDLINAGAKVNDQDDGGDTALISIATVNNPEALKALIEAGAKVDLTNKEGQSALMMAASENCVNNVRALILAGSDLNAKDKEGKTAFTYALEGEHKGVLRFLRSRGAVETLAKPKDEEADKEEVPEK